MRPFVSWIFFFYKCSPNALLNDLKEYKVSHNSVRISYDLVLSIAVFPAFMDSH